MKQISRRKFVAAGAGAAGFTFLPAHVLGRGGATHKPETLRDDLAANLPEVVHERSECEAQSRVPGTLETR